MSEDESGRRESSESGDKSYYSDSESYYSDRSRTNNKKNEDEQEAKKSGKRGAFVFMGNPSEFKALQRGMQKKKVPVDIMNENKLKMSELRNKNLELLDVVGKYEFENRDLRRMLKRQEIHLKRIQLQEDSMPNLIERQSNETKSLTEQMRGLKERLKTQEKRLKEAEGQLDAKQRQLKQLNSLVHQKDLKKRQNLTQQLEESHEQLNNKEDTIRSLERHIENVQKNHRHEMGLKKARQKDSNNEVEDLRREVQRLYSLLQEKEKESAVFNIYSMQHRNKPPHRLSSSIRSTPALHNGAHGDHADDDINHLPVKKSSFDELPLKKSKEKITKKNENVLNEDFGNKKLYAKNSSSNNKYNAANHDLQEIDQKNQELEELERKIQQLNNTNNINNTNNNNTKSNNGTNNNNKPNTGASNKTVGSRNSKGSSKTKNSKGSDKQKEALLERMKKVDEGKYQATATTTSNNNNKLSSRNKASSIFEDYDDYKPSFLDDGDGDDAKKAFRVARKDNMDLFSDDDEDVAGKNNHSKSPVFLNLNNNSNLLPKRPKQQDISLATLNGIESDEDVK